MKATISLATDKGKRKYQEDRYVLNQTADGILMAVFDGHGGDTVAEFCRVNLLVAFNAVADDPTMPTIPSKIKGIFRLLNIATQHMFEGTTASLVFIPSTMDRAFVGVLGDSPVIIKNKDNEFWIGPEHNVRSNPAEVERVKKAGGAIYNGYMFAGRGFSAAGLQLSRALGDHELDSLLSREPEVFEQLLGPGSFVLVGSDGLLDPDHRSGSLAKEITSLVENGKEAPTLMKYAVSRPDAEDNVTALLVRILA